MPSTPGAWLLVLVDAAILLAAVGLAWFLLGRRESAESADRGEWYDGAMTLTREVGRAATSVERPADPDQVARRLLTLSARIDGHVRAAPAGVDEAAYQGLFELGQACRRVAVEHRAREALLGGVPLEDRLESLRQEAGALESRLADTASSKPRSKTANAR